MEQMPMVSRRVRSPSTASCHILTPCHFTGQPIRLTMLSERSNRNPFDSAVMPGRPLSERITAPGGRGRSQSPPRYTQDEAARRGIDRYVPGEGGDRSRSPGRRRGGGGRRPGARREGGNRDQERKGGTKQANPRGKKTQEELDAEMADYFGGGGAAAPDGAGEGNQALAGDSVATGAAAQAAVDDIDMIE